MPDFDAGIATARAPLAGMTPVDRFAAELRRAGGRVFTDPGALASWLLERESTRGYCDPGVLEHLGGRFSSPLVLETTFDRSRIDTYGFAITRAAGAIAETGSIVMNDATTSTRLGALAPWIHIAVVQSSDVLATVADAIRALGDDPYVLWCTGPSKTADVEGILIEGVHGPGEQVALLVPS